jgi:hypothetical protein
MKNRVVTIFYSVEKLLDVFSESLPLVIGSSEQDAA